MTVLREIQDQPRWFSFILTLMLGVAIGWASVVIYVHTNRIECKRIVLVTTEEWEAIRKSHGEEDDITI